MSTYKICLLGGLGVGKTALTIQYISNHFIEEYDPTIEDSYRKRAVFDNESCLLEFIDLATGRPGFLSLASSYFLSLDGVLGVYSITSRSSLEELEGLVYHVKKIREKEKGNSWFPLVVCGNQVDREQYRQVETREGEEMTEMWGGKFFETSAKKRTNVDECVCELVRKIRRERGESSEKGRKKKGRIL